MKHDRARELLLDLAYGELAPDEVRELEAHLASCAGCAAERQQLASVRALAARAAPLEPSVRGRVALLAAAREAGRREIVARRRGEERSPFAAFLRPALWTAAATTALVGIVIGATLKLAGPATERDRLAPEPWSGPAATSPASGQASPEPAPPVAQAEPSSPAALAGPAGPGNPAVAGPSASEPPARREAPAAPPRAPAAAKSAAPSAREERREAVRAPAAADAAADAAPPAPAESAASGPLAAAAPAPSARREAVPAPAPAAPSAAPFAAPVPERLTRAPAAAPAPAPAAGAQQRQAPADPVVDAIERRRAAGELSELRRRPGGCVEDRRGFVDSPRSKILLVVERRAGGLELSRWYDDDGRLRAVASGGWSAVLDVEGAVSREAGAVDPATRSIALEARDASDALFGAARGCPAAPAVP